MGLDGSLVVVAAGAQSQLCAAETAAGILLAWTGGEGADAALHGVHSSLDGFSAGLAVRSCLRRVGEAGR